MLYVTIQFQIKLTYLLAAQVELPTNPYISKDKGRLVNQLTNYLGNPEVQKSSVCYPTHPVVANQAFVAIVIRVIKMSS